MHTAYTYFGTIYTKGGKFPRDLPPVGSLRGKLTFMIMISILCDRGYRIFRQDHLSALWRSASPMMEVFNLALARAHFK